MVAPGKKLDIDYQDKQGVMIIRLKGRLDSIQIPGITQSLTYKINTVPGKLLLNLTDVVYVSSAGLRLILSLKDKVESAGGKFSLCIGSSHVLELLKLTGLINTIKVYGDEETAVTSMA